MKRLQVLDAATLEPRGEAALPAPVSNATWIVGDVVFVETARHNLHLFSLSEGLAEYLSVRTLPPASMSGAASRDRARCR